LDVQQSYDEKILLRRIAEDDGDAFAQIFHRYRDEVYTLALKITGSVSIAEEIVQDVFLKIWMKRSELSDITSFQAFLYTTARNKTYDHLRGIANRRKYEESTQAPAATGGSPDDWMIHKDYQKILNDAIEALPPQQQKVYRLSRLEGLNREEIASQLGVSGDTVKAHLSAALKKVRAYCMARLDISVVIFLLLKNFF
jgi:RNA polymerase sigma-70 factor (ECF subfamily)